VHSSKDRTGVSMFIAGAISSSALLLALVHVIRDKTPIDSIVLSLFVIAMFPWAGRFVKTFEAFGVKGELRAELDEIKGATANATQTAEAAAQIATAKSQGLETIRLQQGGAATLQPNAEAQLKQLAKEYVDTRKRMKPGSERTSEMTSIFGKMAALTSQIDNLDVRQELLNPENDPGRRLIGYAYLYSRPDPEFLNVLVECLTELESKPFEQYWGIKALGKVLDQTANIPPAVIEKLTALLGEFNSRTDRYFALSQILGDVQRRKHS
jgi:hypothetical protein